MSERFHIVIIGGGCSGTALAIRLIRRADPRMQLTLLEPESQTATGEVGGHTDDLIEAIARWARSDMHINLRTGVRISRITRAADLFEVALDDGQHFSVHAVALTSEHWRPAAGEVMVSGLFVLGDACRTAGASRRTSAELQSEACDVAAGLLAWRAERNCRSQTNVVPFGRRGRSTMRSLPPRLVAEDNVIKASECAVVPESRASRLDSGGSPSDNLRPFAPGSLRLAGGRRPATW